MIFTLNEFLSFIDNKILREDVNSKYIDPMSEITFNITQDEFLYTVSLLDENVDKVQNLTRYVVPMYYSFNMKLNETPTINWTEAIACTEVLDISEDPFLKWSIKNDTLCPDSGMQLTSNPLLEDHGSNFNFVLNHCHVAAKALNITDDNCETNDTKVTNYMKNVTLVTRFISKYLDSHD